MPFKNTCPGRKAGKAVHERVIRNDKCAVQQGEKMVHRGSVNWSRIRHEDDF